VPGAAGADRRLDGGVLRCDVEPLDRPRSRVKAPVTMEIDRASAWVETTQRTGDVL
jgi:hypothetical protein